MIAAAAIAAAAGAIGVHTTLRRVVFMPAALSQLAGAGVVVAFLLAHALPQAPVPAVGPGTDTALSVDGAGSWPQSLLDADGASPAATGQEPVPIPMADDPNVLADEPEPPPIPMADDPNVFADEHCDCPPMLPRALAVLFACVGALLFGFVREGQRVTREWLLGTVFIGASAVVLLLGGFIQQELHDVNDVLFGNAIVIASGQMVEAVVVSAVILALHLGLAPSFLVHAFDPLTARAHGVPVRVLDGLLFLSMGVAITTGTRVVGALPEFAFAGFPAMTALTLVRRPRLLIAVAALAGAVAAFLGYWASFVLSLPTGASMAAASLFIFLVVKGAVLTAGKR